MEIALIDLLQVFRISDNLYFLLDTRHFDQRHHTSLLRICIYLFRDTQKGLDGFTWNAF